MPYSTVRVIAFAMLALLLVVATVSTLFLEIAARGGLLAGGIAAALALRPATEATIRS